MCLLRPKPTFRHRNPSRLLLSTSFDNGARRFGHSCRKLPLHVVECDHTHGLCVHLSALRAKKRIAAAPSPVLVVVHITAAHVLRVRHRTACSVQSMRTSSEAGPHAVGHLLGCQPSASWPTAVANIDRTSGDSPRCCRTHATRNRSTARKID